MDSVYKTYRAEVKGVNADEGTVDMYIPVSSDSVDRDGEVVEPMAFKKTLPKFMKRPVLVASHDYRDLTNQIGEWSRLKIEESGLNGKPKYYINEGNEQADWGFKLASKGMAAFSIGFIPKVWEDGDGEKAPRRTYKEVELLEISQVIVPSNREAIQSIRAKSADPIITEICDAVEGELEPEMYKDDGISDESTHITTTLITKPEETDEFIRIPVRDCKVTATIDISKKEGISALYCGKEKLVRTYLFRKDKGWTMAMAKEWVKEHEGKGFEFDEDEGIEEVKVAPSRERLISQEQIIDEIDYLADMIDTQGLGHKARAALKELLKRLPADDTAVEIESEKDLITYQEIKEAVKRIANKQEVL